MLGGLPLTRKMEKVSRIVGAKDDAAPKKHVVKAQLSIGGERDWSGLPSGLYGKRGGRESAAGKTHRKTVGKFEETHSYCYIRVSVWGGCEGGNGEHSDYQG